MWREKNTIKLHFYAQVFIYANYVIQAPIAEIFLYCINFYHTVHVRCNAWSDKKHISWKARFDGFT